MLDLYKQLLHRQYEAALCMLARVIDACPPPKWDAPVIDLKFCQAAFHVLFFTDLYLGPGVDAIRDQDFHRASAATFADYEELEPRRQVLCYTQPFVVSYLAHCREKAARVVAAETPETLAGPSGFDWLKFPRAELHVYNIRHVHHHAAQLSLWLKMGGGEGVKWVSSGWK